jgi:HEAT repeat protein
MMDAEREGRVALEAGASAAALRLAKGEERLVSALWGNGPSEHSLEAILILTEMKTPFARTELARAAAAFRGDERRQAAIWGLGKSGLKSYGDLVPFISDEEENVAYHAIAAFGQDTPRPIIEQLIVLLIAGELRSAIAASEALRVIGSRDALECLVRATNEYRDNIDWLLATLGRLPPDMVREHLSGTAILERIEPMLLVAHGASWLATEDAVTDMAFLMKQNL